MNWFWSYHSIDRGQDLALSASGVSVEEVEEGGGEDGSSTENDGGLE